MLVKKHKTEREHFSCAYGYLQFFSLNWLFVPFAHFSINLVAFLLLKCKIKDFK